MLLALGACESLRQSVWTSRSGVRGLRASGSKAREDAESNARLLGALFGSVEAAAEAIEDSDQTVASHLKVQRDEDGEPRRGHRLRISISAVC